MEINLTDDEHHMFETKDKEDDPSPPSTPMTPKSNGTDYFHLLKVLIGDKLFFFKTEFLQLQANAGLT
eukprot:9258824-Ditylum_brightwellii.AAC.1